MHQNHTRCNNHYEIVPEWVNQFLPTVPTFAIRETDVSRHNGGTSGAPLKPLRDDSALTAAPAPPGGVRVGGAPYFQGELQQLYRAFQK